MYLQITSQTINTLLELIRYYRIISYVLHVRVLRLLRCAAKTPKDIVHPAVIDCESSNLPYYG